MSKTQTKTNVVLSRAPESEPATLKLTVQIPREDTTRIMSAAGRFLAEIMTPADRKRFLVELARQLKRMNGKATR